MAQEKIMNLAAQQYYDEKIKAYLGEKDAEVLSGAKAYADGLADNYDAAGVAQTKVNELANGQVKTNTEAIAKLNGDATTEGSVDKKIADAKSLIDADIDAVEKKADDAQSDADALEADMGNVDELSTTNKTVVGAINEVLAAVGTGGTAAVVTITSETTNAGALKSYTIKQGEATVGVIDIPKDMVVESGEVVVNPEGQSEGTYIKLVLANVSEPLYINVGTLVDIYKAKANATQVQIAIDSSTREISASIVAGSVGTTELTDNAVTTVKIADANVTKAKLSTEVQSSLDKADASAPQTALDAEVLRAKEAEAKALVDAKTYADEEDAKIEARVETLEVDTHVHTNKSILDGITSDKISAWDSAEQNAKDYATGLNNAMNTRVTDLESKVGDGFVAVTNAEIDAMFATVE